MKFFLLTVAVLFTVSIPAKSDTLEDRVKDLEIRMANLENATHPQCIAKVDGVVIRGAYSYDKGADGKWKRSAQFMKESFQIQFHKSFMWSGGTQAALVTVMAPGHQPSCMSYVFRFEDIILY